jgi:hypothetical protein
VAKGWIAIGAKAYGVLFACGGIAIGGISFGGMSIGLLTWGGFAVGAFVWGGCAVGIYALGGVAIGWKVVGGCALGWSAAQGAIAMARDFAQGAVASAGQANNKAAETFFRNDGFYQFARQGLTYARWACIMAIIPLVPIITARWIAFRKAAKIGRDTTAP